MSDAVPTRPATVEDLLALDPELGYELINGNLVQKAMGNPVHSACQTSTIIELGAQFNRRPGGRVPGGWWIRAECDVLLEEDQLFRPDIAGWRRDRVADLPDERPVRIRPDWVCEVLSPSNVANDTVLKFRVHHRTGVPHYWVADPEAGTVAVYAWREDAYAAVVVAKRGERHRLPPFDAIDLEIGVLLGDDPV